MSPSRPNRPPRWVQGKSKGLLAVKLAMTKRASRPRGFGYVCAIVALCILAVTAFTRGAEFANPVFAWAVVALLLAMSLWLFGILNINLPPTADAFAPRHDTYFGNYLWGILTAALSTP